MNKQIVVPSVVVFHEINQASLHGIGWVSFSELEQACAFKIERFIMSQAEEVRDKLRSNCQINLRDFVGLNYFPNKMNPIYHIPVKFSWVTLGKTFNVFEMENPDFCSFMGEDAYCPAKWSERVIDAVGSGLIKVRIKTVGLTQVSAHLEGMSVYLKEWSEQTYLLGK